jgi:hypothetical protein
MVVPFAPHTAWYLWIRPIGRGQPLWKGLGENDFWLGLVLNDKITEKLV